MKKILCVIRVSTTQQETESQHRDMCEFLTEKGLNYSVDEIEWLEVAGASARKVNQQYLDMLNSIKAIITSNTSIKACAFWHLNRLGRWEKYIVDMKDWFITNGIQVYVKNPNLTLLKEDGTLDNGANIAWGVFASMVSYDTMELMDKLKRGRDNLKSQGLYYGGRIRKGFKVNNEKKIVVDWDSMNEVISIFNEFLKFSGGITKYRKELKTRGIELSDKGIWNILKCEDYKEYVGEDVFNKVQNKFKSNNDNADKTTSHVTLANKIIKCRSCGHNYLQVANSYMCYGKKKEHKCNGNSAMISIQLMDTVLWDIASTLHRKWLSHTDTTTIQDLTNKKAIFAQKLATAKNEVKKQEVRKANTKNLYMDAAISETEYKSKMVAIEENTQRLNNDVEYIEESIKALEDDINRLQKPNIANQFALMAKVGDITNRKEMQEIIRQHIKVAYVETSTEYPNTIEIEIIDKYNKVYKYYYQYKKRGKDWIDKLFKKDKQDNLAPYTYSRKTMFDILTNGLNETIDILNDENKRTEVLKKIYRGAITIEH